MKKVIARAMLGAALVGGMAAVAGITAPTAAFAATKGPGISPAIAKQIGDAQKALQAKDFVTAQAKLNEAKAVTGHSPYDDLKIAQLEAYIDLTNKDNAAALVLYKTVIIDSPALPPEEQQQVYQTALELANIQSDWQTAVKAGTKLTAAGAMTDTMMAELATAYFYLKDSANAKAWAQKSIDAAKAANKQPQQAALQILQYVAENSQSPAEALAALKQQVLIYQKPEDWKKLVDRSYVKGITEMQVLDIRRLQLLAGIPMDGNDYRDVAQYEVKSGYPGEAVKFLQAGVSAGSVKSSDPLLAQQRAKAAGDEKTLANNDAAGAKAKSGELDTVVAEQYYGYGRYAEAETAAKRAAGKSGRKDPAEAPMVLGMAQAAQGKYADAKASFAQVPQNSEGQKNVVAMWSLYCDAKLQPPQAAGH